MCDLFEEKNKFVFVILGQSVIVALKLLVINVLHAANDYFILTSTRFSFTHAHNVQRILKR